MAHHIPADRFGNPPEWVPENEDDETEAAPAAEDSGPVVPFDEDEGPF